MFGTSSDGGNLVFCKSECLTKENECLHDYVSISKAEEAFLKQKSRNQWLQLGGQNNSYFHRIVKVRNSKNLISHLWDEHGRKIEDKEQIKRVAVEFYKKLLGSNTMEFDELKAERIEQLVKRRITKRCMRGRNKENYF